MRLHEKYLSPSRMPSNMDLYLVRKSILKALHSALPSLRGTLLDIGCGYAPYKSIVLSPLGGVDSYLGMDLPDNKYQPADLEWDGQRIPLADNSVDSAIATELLEHCPEPNIVLKEVLRVLKPGGVFFFTTPFVWPLHDVPNDFYRYTSYGMKRLLGAVGFEDIQLKPLGGWNASLAQMIGLWAMRRPMNRLVRWFALLALWPAWLLLCSWDSDSCLFKENGMFTGLSGMMRKP